MRKKGSTTCNIPERIGGVTNNVKNIPSKYFLARWSKAANPNIIVGENGNTIEVDCNVPLSERFSDLSCMAQTLVTTGSMSDELAEVAKKWLKRGIKEVEACRKTLKDDTEEPTSSNIVETSLDVNDNITVCAPPLKKSKGEPKGRIKGFYDDMKKMQLVKARQIQVRRAKMVLGRVKKISKLNANQERKKLNEMKTR